MRILNVSDETYYIISSSINMKIEYVIKELDDIKILGFKSDKFKENYDYWINELVKLRKSLEEIGMLEFEETKGKYIVIQKELFNNETSNN